MKTPLGKEDRHQECLEILFFDDLPLPLETVIEKLTVWQSRHKARVVTVHLKFPSQQAHFAIGLSLQGKKRPIDKTPLSFNPTIKEPT